MEVRLKSLLQALKELAGFMTWVRTTVLLFKLWGHKNFGWFTGSVPRYIIDVGSPGWKNGRTVTTDRLLWFHDGRCFGGHWYFRGGSKMYIFKDQYVEEV